jgi:hypothetical protein
MYSTHAFQIRSSHLKFSFVVPKVAGKRAALCFTPRLEISCPDLSFVVGFLHHFKHLAAWCFKVGHDRFLLRHFQFIIHQSYHSTPYIGKSGSQLTG